jgi:hypothetical protein
MRSFLLTVSLLLLGAGALLVPGAFAVDPTLPTYYPPDQAQTLADYPAVPTADHAGTQVSVAAATSSGPDMDIATSGPQAICWFTDQNGTQWGHWPYEQKVTEWRTWCADFPGGKQTYRSSTVHPAATLCSWSNTWQSRVGGGNGYSWTNVRTGADFACPTSVPWITLHPSDWQSWVCNTWGRCEWHGAGRS